MIIRLTESLHFIFLSCLVNNSRRDGEQQRTHNGKMGRVGSIDQRFRFLTMNVDMASSDWHDFETKKGNRVLAESRKQRKQMTCLNTNTQMYNILRFKPTSPR